MINTPTGSGARSDGYEIRTAAVREGIPCVTTMTGASAAARAIFAAAGATAPSRGACRSSTRRPPCGQRRCPERRIAGAPTDGPSGRRHSARAPVGIARRPARAAAVRGRQATARPAATGSSRRSTPSGRSRVGGQFFMLSAADGWGQRDGRPYLPRAFSVAEAQPADEGVRLDFLRGGGRPGDRAARRARDGRRLWLTGPARSALLAAERARLADRRRDPGRRRDRARAAGDLAPPARRPRRADRGRCSGSGTASTRVGWMSCSPAARCGWRARTATRATSGYVTDLLAVLLEGDSARGGGRLRLRAPGDARGGAGDVRRARRRRRAGDGGADGVRLRRLLRVRRPAGGRRATCACASTGRS